MARARKAKPTTHQSETYQLRIELKGVKPKVWRRILVPADIVLGHLHEVLQIAMGWSDAHLHQFTIGDVDYGEREAGTTMPLKNEERFKLKEALGGRPQFLYFYDFGDGWEHVVKVEKIHPPGMDTPVPTCLDGANACPPEDIGGPYGYAEFVAAVADPAHERHEEVLEWHGGDFDPTEFDALAVNEVLEPQPKPRSKRL